MLIEYIIIISNILQLCYGCLPGYHFTLLSMDRSSSLHSIYVLYNIRTKIVCAKKCVENVECLSYFYDNSSKVCRLVSERMSVSDLTSQENGSSYYILIEPWRIGSDTPTTTESTVTTTEETTTVATTTTTTTTTVTVIETCPTDWTLFQSSCYRLYTDQWLDWYESKTFCESHGAYLVEITSDDENTFVKDEAIRLTSGWIWLGGDDTATEGTFRYVRSGTPISYSDFAPLQPDNDNYQEHYLAMSDGTYEHPYRWVDAAQTPDKNVLCEQDPSLSR